MRDFFEGVGFAALMPVVAVVAIVGCIVIGLFENVDVLEGIIWIVFGSCSVVIFLMGAITKNVLGVIVSLVGILLGYIVTDMFVHECMVTRADRMLSFVITLVLFGPLTFALVCGIFAATIQLIAVVAASHD